MQRGAERIAAIPEFFISIFVIFIFLKGNRNCFGIFCFFIILVINDDAPNKPVSNGKREFLIGRFKVDKPRNPESMKIIRANVFDFFSLIIKYMEADKSIRNIMVFMYV